MDTLNSQNAAANDNKYIPSYLLQAFLDKFRDVA